MDLFNLNAKYPEAQLDAIEAQAHTYRFNTMPVIKPVSDAQHTGRGAQIMVLVLNDLHQLKLRREPDLAGVYYNDYSILSAFCMHDIAESITGDIILDVKAALPQATVLEEHVYDWLFRQSSGKGAINMPELYAFETSVVRVVDIAEFVMTCITEVEMGNKRVLPWLGDGLRSMRKCMDENTWMHRIPTLWCIVGRGTSIHYENTLVEAKHVANNNNTSHS